MAAPDRKTDTDTPDSDRLDTAALADRAAALVEAARAAGADAADASAGLSRSTGVSVREGAVEDVESAETGAITLRVFVGERSASVSTNVPDAPADIAERAIAMARAAPPDRFSGLAPADRLARALPDLDLFDPSHIAMEEMERRALEAEAVALATPGVTRSNGAGFGRTLGATALVTSHGFAGHYAATSFSLSASVVAGEGEGMERDYDFDTRRHLDDLREGARIGAEAGRRAVARLGGTPVASGTVTVVFDHRVARGLVGHLLGAINGASVARGTSFLRAARGTAVLPDHVRISDDPTRPRALGSRPFDAEGLAGEPLDLVEGGVLRHFTLDGHSARQLGLAMNARASRAGSGTRPSASNVTLHAGPHARDALVASLKRGLYVTELIGQGVNLVTGDYSRGASGFLIEDGVIGRAVTEVTIAANLRDMFARLIVCDDVTDRFTIDTPTLAVEGMTLAGR